MDGQLQRVAGRNLKALRENRGLSQEALAQLLGVHRTYLEGVELGQHSLTLKSIERIARLIDIEPMVLLKEDRDIRAHYEVPPPMIRVDSNDPRVEKRTYANQAADTTPPASLVSFIKTTVGRNLLRERENKRASQMALADASWLPPLTIRRIENAKSEPRLHTTILLSLALDVPLQGLLVGLPQGGSKSAAMGSGLYLPPGLDPKCPDHI